VDTSSPLTGAITRNSEDRLAISSDFSWTILWRSVKGDQLGKSAYIVKEERRQGVVMGTLDRVTY